jgi:angiotensin-converting enzyme
MLNDYRTLLEKGFADNWQDVLFDAIGVREMDGSAIKEYFTPLTNYLKEQQATHGYPLGWKMDAFKDFYQEPPCNSGIKLSRFLIVFLTKPQIKLKLKNVKKKQKHIWMNFTKWNLQDCVKWQ